MKKILVYEDEKGYCRIVKPINAYQHAYEADDNAVARLHAVALPNVSEFFVCDESKLPKDRTFRDAWKKGDVNEPVKVDLSKAIEIHRLRLQVACEEKIGRLDSELVKAVEKDNLPSQVAIRSTKKIVKDLHKMDLTHCKTVEQLKYSVPKELYDVWNFYPLD